MWVRVWIGGGVPRKGDKSPLWRESLFLIVVQEKYYRAGIDIRISGSDRELKNHESQGKRQEDCTI